MRTEKTSELVVEEIGPGLRAVKLGKRRLTLNVFRQLDYVRPEDVDPIGRVNTGIQYGKGVFARVEVVGLYIYDNTLVRSYLLSDSDIEIRRLMARGIEEAKAREIISGLYRLPLVILGGTR